MYFKIVRYYMNIVGLFLVIIMCGFKLVECYRCLMEGYVEFIYWKY